MTTDAPLTGAIRDAWAADAAIYDRLPGHGLRTYEERAQLAALLAAAVGSRPQRLVDLGTGTGALALLLAALGHRVTGIDLTEEMVAVARRKATALGLDVTFIAGDAMRLDFSDHAVDGVVSRHLLWTLPDPPAALREWARVTRPGGTIVVLDGLWNDPSWNARLRGRVAAPLRRIFAPPSHTGASYAALSDRLPLSGGATPQQAEALLRAAGLVYVTVRDLSGLRRAERAARPWYDRFAAPRVTWLARGQVVSSEHNKPATGY